MLFGYPITATLNNWFHECLCEAVRTIHRLADANQAYPAWPGVLPAAHQKALTRRWRLSEHFKNYDDAVRLLTKIDRDVVLAALDGENRIPQLLSGADDCIRINGLPLIVQGPVEALFKFAYDILDELKVRRPHYDAIHVQMPAHVCPFCGIQRFASPRSKQEALDHYLVRTRYPFAAANLRNLVPMCHTCNSGYKLAADMVRRADESPRVAFDPYNHTRLQVSLDDSDPFGGTTDNTPCWRVRFIPETSEVSTWDDVFSVRKRYQEDHLNDDYKPWINKFATFARKIMGSYSDQGLIDALRNYEELQDEQGFDDRAFLKAAVFRMLRRHSEAGNQRLLGQLRDLVCRPAAVPVAAAPEPAEGALRTLVVVEPGHPAADPQLGAPPVP